MAGEKTEKATSKRKKDERKKGNVIVSKEVTTICSLLAVFFSLKFMLPLNFDLLSEAMVKYFTIGATAPEINTVSLGNIYIELGWLFFRVTIPVLCIAALVGGIITAGQTRMLYSTKALEFKGDRINPISGFKKMFSLRSLVELLKSILKIILLIVIIYFTIRNKIVLFPKMMDMGLLPSITYAANLLMSIVTYVGIFFAFLAAADYLYQWWQYEKNLRMTKQEVKDEFKQMEGDPQIKAQIRSLQQQRARQRMMQSVPEADVVIRNPTHFAVALKYDFETDVAPMVVAKGMDIVALRVIAIAEENFIPIVEDRPLARSLYAKCEIGYPIHEDFYPVIATLFNHFYKDDPRLHRKVEETNRALNYD